VGDSVEGGAAFSFGGDGAVGFPTVGAVGFDFPEGRHVGTIRYSGFLFKIYLPQRTQRAQRAHKTHRADLGVGVGSAVRFPSDFEGSEGKAGGPFTGKIEICVVCFQDFGADSDWAGQSEVVQIRWGGEVLVNGMSGGATYRADGNGKSFDGISRDEWGRLRLVLLRALEPYPEALEAVVSALREASRDGV
jgi:hypothetical protein